MCLNSHKPLLEQATVLNASQDAFKVSRATLYRWKQNHQQGGISALHDASRVPRRRRRRNWSPKIIDKIRRLRQANPNVGSEKIYCWIKEWCNKEDLLCPKPRTIARLIAEAPDKMRCSPQTSKKRPRRNASKRRPRLGKEKAQYPGHCIALDTVQRFANNTRRYLYTAVELYSRFAISVACCRANSKTAAAFVQLVETVFPGDIKQILTDNGSEFQGDFDAYLQRHNIKHCYTYPRCPKMNAFNERFNRTIQEEFVDYYEDILMTDLAFFNDVLFEYLESNFTATASWSRLEDSCSTTRLLIS